MNLIDKYAAIIKMICDKEEPGKKKLQKLLYLMERKGVRLHLNYSIHFFGPYSAKLDNVIHVLESQGEIQIDTSGRTHIIRRGEISVGENLIEDESSEIQFVLDNFLNKTALELEAITTLDYAANSILKGCGNDEDIINQVKKIKGEKFTQDYLETELMLLKEHSFVK